MSTPHRVRTCNLRFRSLDQMCRNYTWLLEIGRGIGPGCRQWCRRTFIDLQGANRAFGRVRHGRPTLGRVASFRLVAGWLPRADGSRHGGTWAGSSPRYVATRAILSAFALAVGVICLSFRLVIWPRLAKRACIGCARRMRAARVLLGFLS